MYERILLASDGSDNAWRAAEEAVKIASLCKGCVIEIVHVVDITKSKANILETKDISELEVQGNRIIQPIISMMEAKNITYEVTMLHGIPAATLIKYANDGLFDLMVVGRKGLSSIRRMILGSVSKKAINEMDCPVLLVK